MPCTTGRARSEASRGLRRASGGTGRPRRARVDATAASWPADPAAPVASARDRRPGGHRDPGTSAPVDERVDERVDPTATAASGAPGHRDRAGAIASAAGRRLGAGFSSVAERLREYQADDDHDTARPGTHPAAEHGTHDGTDDGGPGRLATVTDVIDAAVPSAADHAADDSGAAATGAHATPIGAGVRAAETAREARVAKRRRRLLERAEVRRFTRRARHRRAAWITVAAVVVVFGASILVAVTSPLMALRTIEVRGTDRVDATALRQALSDQVGTPLARLDFDEVKRDIAGFPLIESYVTEEVPPHTLVVTVTERTPVVAVPSGKSFDLVDPAGIVVQSSPKRPEGVPVADVARAELGSPVFRTMTEVVLSLPSTVRNQVTDVRASTADDVTLTLGDGSTVVWGSPDSSDAKAALLAALVKDHTARNPDTKVEFDVSAPDNGIVRAKD